MTCVTAGGRTDVTPLSASPVGGTRTGGAIFNCEICFPHPPIYLERLLFTATCPKSALLEAPSQISPIRSSLFTFQARTELDDLFFISPLAANPISGRRLNYCLSTGHKSGEARGSPHTYPPQPICSQSISQHRFTPNTLTDKTH
ncbi:hypothetical protein MTP99_006643 [Tenebrio molitor]|nr:hypothetical protein MTP99_006643 [Tenebrio molitor]